MSTTDGDALRFDGRTAIITGAGGKPSLGRAHALLLAARGANVVVNDIGHDPETPGYVGRASAESVVDEIRSAGGRAVADTHSVASADRSEEHTSELQSLMRISYAVFCLKKKNTNHRIRY